MVSFPSPIHTLLVPKYQLNDKYLKTRGTSHWSSLKYRILLNTIFIGVQLPPPPPPPFWGLKNFFVALYAEKLLTKQ